MRIISLVPSWTEYLVDIGLSDQIQGRTKFCIRAGKNKEFIPIIGGTKTFHVDRIESLKPDLIIASKEENDKTLVEACTRFADVLVTDVKTVIGAIEACHDIAAATRQKSAARRLTDKIQYAWGEPRKPKCTGSYVVWKDPMMLAGTDTFIHAVMQWWGIDNAAKNLKDSRYPEISAQAWSNMECGHVLLPSEPFPFQAKHIPEFAARGKEAQLVDGEAFSWYGSRMLHAAPYLNEFTKALSA